MSTLLLVLIILVAFTVVMVAIGRMLRNTGRNQEHGHRHDDDD